MTEPSHRTVAIVSPQFPPSTLAGVHRARHMSSHLLDHGWRPVVVRVDERFYSERTDPKLAGLLPAGLKQVRTGALPCGVMRKLGVGDLGLRAYFHIQAALDKVVKTEAPHVIFITGFPFYPMLMTSRLKRRYGLPVVLDFQDPWVSAHGATRSLFSKEGLSHQLAVWLEPHAIRRADYITSVSDVQNADMAARHSWIDPDRMAAIPIGGDPEDFVSLRKRPHDCQEVTLDPGLLNFSYVGTFLPRATPLARQVFRALAQLRTQSPELANRIRLNFVGSSNSPDDHTTFRVAPIAESEGVGDLVREIPQRVPFLEALNLLANSTALLLIGSDERHYTASKIYPALMSGTPYLSLFHEESSAHAILSQAKGGMSLAFTTQEALEGLTPRLVEGFAQLATEPDKFPTADSSAYEAYTAHAVAGRFAAVFDSLAK